MPITGTLGREQNCGHLRTEIERILRDILKQANSLAVENCPHRNIQAGKSKRLNCAAREDWPQGRVIETLSAGYFRIIAMQFQPASTLSDV
jgi:hypothetical protein